MDSDWMSQFGVGNDREGSRDISPGRQVIVFSASFGLSSRSSLY